MEYDLCPSGGGDHVGWVHGVAENPFEIIRPLTFSKLRVAVECANPPTPGQQRASNFSADRARGSQNQGERCLTVHLKGPFLKVGL